jgi:hypothetical protein
MIDRDNDRKHVAWDIETTGFAWEDEITVSGFWFPGGTGTAELILNTNNTEVEADQYEAHLETVSGGVTVTVTPVPDETRLLKEIQQVVFDRFDREYARLIAFNASSWKGGFDLPFVRTRCLTRGVDWVFDGIQFCDLWEPVQKRINTTEAYRGKHDDVNSLTGAHAILFKHDAAEVLGSDETADHPWYHDRQYDPFEDSGSASAHYDRGEYLPICQHNLADVHRTWELGELVRQVVPSKDITTKKL